MKMPSTTLRLVDIQCCSAGGRDWPTGAGICAEPKTI